jgi:hypothetical protein
LLYTQPGFPFHKFCWGENFVHMIFFKSLSLSTQFNFFPEKNCFISKNETLYIG